MDLSYISKPLIMHACMYTSLMLSLPYLTHTTLKHALRYLQCNFTINNFKIKLKRDFTYFFKLFYVHFSLYICLMFFSSFSYLSVGRSNRIATSLDFSFSIFIAARLRTDLVGTPNIEPTPKRLFEDFPTLSSSCSVDYKTDSIDIFYRLFFCPRKLSQTRGG